MSAFSSDAFLSQTVIPPTDNFLPAEAPARSMLDGDGRPTFPHTIDSTILAAFRSCPQKMFRTYVQHWKPTSESVHLVAGAAFAKGLEVARKAFFEGIASIPTVTYPAEHDFRRKVIWTERPCPKLDQTLAVSCGLQALIAAYGDFDCPPESAKSLERTAGALEFYFERYPLGEDGMLPITLASGQSGIEFSFANPLGINHPISGDPLLYTGRADLICHFADAVWILDDKTTSSLGASWANQWELRSQFTGYCWSARQQGLDPAGCLVRGVSILKTKYDTQQVMTYRTPFEVNRWYDQVHHDLERMINCWKTGWWDYALDNACTEYGGCSLTRICKSQSPDDYLPMYFHQRVWDPLARKEMTVQEWEAEWAGKTLIG